MHKPRQDPLMAERPGPGGAAPVLRESPGVKDPAM